MIWAAGLFLLSTLFGCEAPQYTYVLQSPYFVTTDYDYENPVEDFDLEVLQEFIDEAYDPETQEIVLDNLGPELRAKIESIEAPLVMSNGFADTIIHTKPRKVLTLRDIEAIKAELLGQYADGWGEGLEQVPFDFTEEREELYISLYGGKEWELELYGDYYIGPTTGNVIPLVGP